MPLVFASAPSPGRGGGMPQELFGRNARFLCEIGVMSTWSAGGIRHRFPKGRWKTTWKSGKPPGETGLRPVENYVEDVDNAP